MIPVDTLIAFFAASLLLALVPGPDNLFVLAESAARGARAGLMITIGLCTGLLVHTAAVAAGIATLLAVSPVAFTLLKLAGAAYLLWLAWQALATGSSDSETTASQPERSGRALYLRGILMNISNPKVALFFLAFLPQFTDPMRGPVALQTVLLGLVFIIAALSVFSVISLSAGALGGYLRQSSGARTAMKYLTATLFTGLAVRLLFSYR
ncbi:LysE family translocator [Prosthecochloris sp. N3]|uniref:LysE family translocator n=1 Tax=Prosthecochloris ethylica TaxID=2743976 RepID=A0ABR9XSZ9_9CHLB|nr:MULTISPECIES: LysE family translocator [Prosthecochloris]MEC9486659.1 LysE family translocator [Prosthecochloris sp.]MBF0586941.1 LysE family translocator [Prosthecochloris ethylica]MBF0637182.1 LysE family translocator [Prosthecochloris ethylica]NUK48190.1 LysE family translocator [Prosthecochloris ethylica]RNA64885.1 LysE family translocator [Prosthecochloris sp. ZM_2]